jgi:hypothetical protein
MTTASTTPEAKSPAPRGDRALISQLEASFREVTELLYDTRIPPAELSERLAPFLAEDIVFVDPWQTGGGRETYRRGAEGFHRMLRFDFDITQLNVQLEQDQTRGRAIVDGIMNLRQFSWLYTYPLRTILVYDFTLERGADGRVQPLIHFHEEMWSLADMITAVPGVNWFYTKVFRPAFSVGFLAASELYRRREARSPGAAH